MRRALLSQFDQYVKLNKKKIPPEVLTSLSGIELLAVWLIPSPLICRSSSSKSRLCWRWVTSKKRMEHLLKQLETELDILQVEKRIRGRVKRQMEKSQREYYLNEQVKAIQKELGELDENADLDDLEKRIKAAGMTKEAREKKPKPS